MLSALLLAHLHSTPEDDSLQISTLQYTYPCNAKLSGEHGLPTSGTCNTASHEQHGTEKRTLSADIVDVSFTVT